MKKFFVVGLVIFAVVIGFGLAKPNAAPATTATCNPGTYKASDGTCVYCARGSFSSTSDATHCALARAGSFVADNGAIADTLCAAGTYSSTPGSIACQPCPKGTTSPAGAIRCEKRRR